MIGDINALNNVELNIDSSRLQDSISKKIESTYQNLEFTVKEYSIENQRIARTPDGDICMCSDVIITGSGPSGDETKTGISILTVLEKASSLPRRDGR